MKLGVFFDQPIPVLLAHGSSPSPHRQCFSCPWKLPFRHPRPLAMGSTFPRRQWCWLKLSQPRVGHFGMGHPYPEGNAVDSGCLKALSCLNQCKSTFTSFPRRREPSFFKIFRISAFAGTTK